MLRILAVLALLSPASVAAPTGAPMSLPPLTTLAGAPLPDASLAGKVVLFVNVASRCGYTRQYDGLQKLWSELKDRGFVIVGAPCNQFGGQEPGSSEEIQSFCKLNYGVDFPLLEKQDVNGPGRSALYQRLVSSPAGGGKDVKWNFEKFLVGRDGQVIARFPSSVAPESPELRAAIEAALAAK
jgi:glutathione peroxidase